MVRTLIGFVFGKVYWDLDLGSKKLWDSNLGSKNLLYSDSGSKKFLDSDSIRIRVRKILGFEFGFDFFGPDSGLKDFFDSGSDWN